MLLVKLYFEKVGRLQISPVDPMYEYIQYVLYSYIVKWDVQWSKRFRDMCNASNLPDL